MAQKFSLQLDGFKEVQAFLDSMAKKEGEKLMRKAISSAGQILLPGILNGISRLTHPRKGHLSGNTKGKITRSARYGNVSYEVSGPYYGQFVDRGHKIVREGVLGTQRIKQKARVAPGGRKQARYGGVVGFAQPRPFIRQPFEQNKSEMEKRISTVLRAELFKAWARHVKRSTGL